jgi:hypothetical protein
VVVGLVVVAAVGAARRAGHAGGRGAGPATDGAADGAAGDRAQQAAAAGGLGLDDRHLAAHLAGHGHLLDHGGTGEDAADFLRVDAQGGKAYRGEKDGLFHGKNSLNCWC